MIAVPSNSSPIDMRGKLEVRFFMEQLVLAFRWADKYSPWETGTLLVAVISQVARVAEFLQETREKSSISLQAAHSVEVAYQTLESTSEYINFADLAHKMGWSADHLRRMLRFVFGQYPS